MTTKTDIESAAETVLDEEELQVFLWRHDQLRVHGYDEADAARLAADPAVDLERARRLARLGCRPELAARILA
jgi:hypothetical protein